MPIVLQFERVEGGKLLLSGEFIRTPFLTDMRDKTNRIFVLTLSLILANLQGGCSQNPQVRRQKFYEQGIVYFDKGKYPEAVISFGRALQIDPRFAPAHFRLAQCHERQGSWAAAVQELGRAIDLAPDDWQAQIELGRILLAAGKGGDAKDRAMLVLGKAPQNMEAQILLSNADTVLGNLKDALLEARDAVKMAPDRPLVYVNLAVIEERAGSNSEAEVHLRKAASLDPTSMDPIMALGNFRKGISDSPGFGTKESLAPHGSRRPVPKLGPGSCG